MRAVIAVADSQNLDDICTILKMCLPNLGLLLSDSGSSCIQKTKEHSPDLVIMDYHLPDLSTLDVIEQVRQLTPSPILVLSDVRNDADVTKAIECGADEFCTTPIMQLEFAAHVRALLQRRRGVNASKSNTQSGDSERVRTTIGIKANTKDRLDSSRAPGQCYDGFLCEPVDLWEKTHSTKPLSRR